MFLRFAYIGLCLLSIAISFYVKAKVEKFLEKNTAITNEKSLEEYKSVVRFNMYAALAQILLVVSAFGSFIAYILQGLTAFYSFFLLCFAISFIKHVGQLEDKARMLTCANAELERKYENISHAWKKKALPDF